MAYLRDKMLCFNHWLSPVVGVNESPATRLPWKLCCRIAGWPPILSIGWSSGKEIREAQARRRKRAARRLAVAR